MSDSNDSSTPGYKIKYSGSPVIEPNVSGITFSPNTNETITCQSDEPIQWKPFKVFEIKSIPRGIFFEQYFDGQFDVKYRNLTSDSPKYESILELINIDYTYVGYFYCIKNATQLNTTYGSWKADEASKIYIYVNGKYQRYLYA